MFNLKQCVCWVLLPLLHRENAAIFKGGHKLCNYKASEQQSSNLNPAFLALGLILDKAPDIPYSTLEAGWAPSPFRKGLGLQMRLCADRSGEKRIRVEGEQESARQSPLPLHQSLVRSPNSK